MRIFRRWITLILIIYFLFISKILFANILIIFLVLDFYLPEIYVNFGFVIEFLKGDEKGAIIAYTEAIKLNPKYAKAYIMRACARMRLNDFFNAIWDCDIAINLNSKLIEAYINRSTAYICTDRYKEAIDDCDSAIGLNSNYSKAYDNRAKAKYKMKNIAGAIEDLKIASKLYSSEGNMKSSVRIDSILNDLKEGKDVL